MASRMTNCVAAARRGADGPFDCTPSQISRSRRVVAVVRGFLGRHSLDRGMKVQFRQLPLQLPTVTIDQRWYRCLDGERRPNGSEVAWPQHSKVS